MRTLLSVFPIAALLLLFTTGCGDSEPGDGPVTLKFVVWKPNNPAAWEEALARFHEAHPGIRVEREIGPASTTQLHDLLAQKLLNRDTSVDVYLMDVIWTPEFAAKGWAQCLEGLFPPQEREKFFEACIDADTYEGKLYAVPLFTDAGVFFHRKDLLEKYGFEPPQTWAEMIEQIGVIREGEKDPGLHGFSGQFKQYEGLVCDMLEFVHSNGGRLADPDTPEAIEAVRFVRDVLLRQAAPRGVLSYEEPESLDLFKSGGAIFMRSWPYAWSQLMKGELAGKVGISVLPTFKEGKNTSTLGGWRFGISAFSEHPQEAWTFVAFMTSPQLQRHFAVESGLAPARRALYRDEEVLKANPHFADLLPVFETATPRPRSPIYPRLSHILQRYLHTAICREDSDIEGLARQAAADIRKELEKLR